MTVRNICDACSDTFEHEKAVNVKEVKEMEEMEKDLVKMVREAEKLRLELISAEQQTHSES